MSTYAQRVQLGPFFDGGALQGGAKMYHYAVGSSTLKDIYLDRAKGTTLAQPFVADADGIFNFFADGLYKLIIVGPDSTGPAVDVLYTLDDWQMIDPAGDITWAEESAVTSASTIAIGPGIWQHVTGSTTIAAITMTTPFAWLVFDGNLTLTYSASLLTPAGIDLAVRANDVLFVLNEGSGVVRVAGHSHYDGLIIATRDSRTNSVDVALTVRSTTSGTPAAGIGTGILIQSESADETTSDTAQIEAAYSDVGAGTEDSYVQLLLRVAGAALTACWRFAATGAFKGILTHANTADRTYTLPNFDGTFATLAGTETLTGKTMTSAGNTFTINSGGGVKQGGLATATGSASGNTYGQANITLNDYAFSPNIQQTLVSTVIQHVTPYQGADSSTTVGRFGLADTSDTSDTYVIRWRYITASDDPTMWVALDASGAIAGVWVSDDPTPDGVPGLAVSGGSALLLKAADLERWAELSAYAGAAADYIRDRNMKPQHQAFRALQLLTGQEAPAQWLYENCQMVNGNVRLVAGATDRVHKKGKP